jgi:DNA-binding transcriptional regulator LsrR (DeoR family)
VKEGQDGRASPQRAEAQRRRRAREYPRAAFLDAKVAQLIDRGLTQREVAARLGISQQRVAQRLQRYRMRIA